VDGGGYKLIRDYNGGEGAHAKLYLISNGNKGIWRTNIYIRLGNNYSNLKELKCIYIFYKNNKLKTDMN
jgi:hypothetical protein